ncbi:MAG: phospholipid carrier-dependent glycosyltransferase, partial [Candidatus Heimdallarchaeota archaeon]|nr:phospholipid carrier-dependent glycosyltransferase [Candidatus Heimdallarchaeota archaeon]
MMLAQIDIRVILPIVSILGMGFLIVDVFKKKIMKINSSDSLIDYFIESLLFGTIFLVVPMLIISIIADKIGNTTILERFVYVYLAVALAYLIFKIYLWVRRKLPTIVLKEKKIPQGLEVLLQVIIGLMIFFFILQGLVYPLRGWDFLHFYLPNSFRIYLTGQLGVINELNFMPQFKPPVNILLYAYGFFVTQSEMIQLIPLLFLTGTVFLCYKIAKFEGLTKKSSLLSSIALLATPFTFFLIYEFQYYQEIYITFFTTATYFFFRKFLKSENSKNQFYNALLASLALSGCVLSKVSGFVIPFVIFVAMPSDMVGKVIRSIIVAGFAFQLIRKSIF